MAVSHNGDDDDDNIPIPSRSRGVYFGAHGGAPVWEQSVVLLPSRRPPPVVLVRVYAVGINPVDAKGVIGDKVPHQWHTMQRLAHKFMVQGTRVGFDFAGVVVDTQNDDDDISKFPPGTRVFGTMPPLQGSASDYLWAPVHQLAKAPDRLSLVQAAALPLVGLTAWQALQPHIRRGMSRVLVVGGSGGTGHVALQVARGLGAAEIATVCSTRNVAFCKDCGATRVVEYTNNNNNNIDSVLLELESSGPFDVILDCVTSADPRDDAYHYPQRIRSNPRLVTDDHLYQRLGGRSSDWIRAGLARPQIFPHSWLWKDARERLFWIRFPHSSEELESIAKLADEGLLVPCIQTVYPELSATNVQQAFDEVLSRRVQGKVVVQVLQETL